MGRGRHADGESDPHWLNHIGPPSSFPTGGSSGSASARVRAHVELRSAKGEPVRDVTSGDWQVERIHGVHGGHVYVAAAAAIRVNGTSIRAPIDGATSNRSPKVEQLSREPGVHDVNWAPNGGWTLTTVTRRQRRRVMLGGGPRQGS